MREIWLILVHMSDVLLQPYGPIRALAQDLFCVDGEWYDTAFGRRMTIVRLRDGSLVVHSAIQMAEKDMAELDRLGPVRWIVVPNAFHDSEAPFYAQRYPEARVYVPGRIRGKCEKRMRVTGTLARDWPLAQELPAVTFEGTLAEESLLVHLSSGTLIVTDMAFNVSASDFKNPVERRILGQWNGILDVLGPSRLTRYVVARDRSRVGSVLDRLSKIDFDRVIVSHGKIVESGGKRLFFAGYDRMYGLFGR